MGSWDRVSLCSRGYPGTYSGLELRAQGSSSLCLPSIVIKGVYHCARLGPFLLIFFFLFLCECLCTCACRCPWRYQIPWSWSYRNIWANWYRCRDANSSLPQRATSALNHWTISLASQGLSYSVSATGLRVFTHCLTEFSHYCCLCTNKGRQHTEKLRRFRSILLVSGHVKSGPGAWAGGYTDTRKN